MGLHQAGGRSPSSKQWGFEDLLLLLSLHLLLLIIIIIINCGAFGDENSKPFVWQ